MTPLSNNPENTDPDASELHEVGCLVPWRHFEIYRNGDVAACCHAWLPEVCGNLLQDNIADIIDNPRREQIKESMRSGCFEYCRSICPELATLHKFGKSHHSLWSIKPREQLDTLVQHRPYLLYLSYDNSCNLQCPSCRSNLMMLNLNDNSDMQTAKTLDIHLRAKILIDTLLDRGHAVHLSITGSGDAFASPLYWQYLQDLSLQAPPSALTIDLQTNGTLMTNSNLEKISNLWKNIRNISVSVDAATEETYSMVRKGGNFKKLCNNLENLDRLVLAGAMPKLVTWQSNFVVQSANFRELKTFVQWHLNFKSINQIWTNLIAKWGHLTDERFVEMAVWHKDHADRNELMDILRDPIFQHPKIRLGNLNNL